MCTYRYFALRPRFLSCDTSKQLNESYCEIQPQHSNMCVYRAVQMITTNEGFQDTVMYCVPLTHLQ